MPEYKYCKKHALRFGSIKCPMCAADEATQKAVASVAAQNAKSALEACRASTGTQDNGRQFTVEEYGQFSIEALGSTDKKRETSQSSYNKTVADVLNKSFQDWVHAEKRSQPKPKDKEFDPTGRDQHEAGAKLDGGKPLAGVLGDFSLALLAVAEVGTYGTKIYSRGGWQSVPDGETRYLDAEWRHLLKRRHEEYDVDSGLLHDAHRAWNILAALELKLRRTKGETECMP